MRKTLRMQVKETSYTLTLDAAGDSKVEITPTSRFLRVRTVTRELTLEPGEDYWLGGKR